MALPAFDALLDRDATHDCSGYGRDHVCVRIAAAAELPTRFGDFHAVGFWNPVDGKEHAAFVHGHEALDGEAVPVRIHSECLTGDAIGSLRCDCRDQLEASLRAAREAAVRDPALPAPGGPWHRPDQQDPRLRAPGPRPGHGRGEHRARVPRRRARLLHRRAHARLARRAVHPADDQQPAQDRGAAAARRRGRRPDPAGDARPTATTGATSTTKARKCGHLIDDPTLEQEEPRSSGPRRASGATSGRGRQRRRAPAGRTPVAADAPVVLVTGATGRARSRRRPAIREGRRPAGARRDRPRPPRDRRARAALADGDWLPVVGDLRDREAARARSRCGRGALRPDRRPPAPRRRLGRRDAGRRPRPGRDHVDAGPAPVDDVPPRSRRSCPAWSSAGSGACWPCPRRSP